MYLLFFNILSIFLSFPPPNPRFPKPSVHWEFPRLSVSSWLAASWLI